MPKTPLEALFRRRVEGDESPSLRDEIAGQIDETSRKAPHAESDAAIRECPDSLPPVYGRPRGRGLRTIRVDRFDPYESIRHRPGSACSGRWSISTLISAAGRRRPDGDDA
ncbi:MAG: hypothetical protein MZV70_01155 [Desulfobacterales bacterium]|nr:hypothetical protein [Desulfobacterales bacterium]